MQDSAERYAPYITVDFETNCFQSFVLTEVRVSWYVEVLVRTFLFGEMDEVEALNFTGHSFVYDVCIGGQLLSRYKVKCNFTIGEYFS